AGRRVTVLCSPPPEPATDLLYIIPSTPLMASSSGVATVSAITFGLAPGYTVRTTTEGGTTSGYSPTGSSGIAIRPAAKITIDSTAAKIGRSMKKREKSMAGPCVRSGGRMRKPRRRADGAVAEAMAAGPRAGAAAVGSAGGHGRAGRRGRVHGHRLRHHRHAREEHLLQAAHDHPVARGQPGSDHAQAADIAAQHHVAAQRGIAVAQHVDVL